MTLNSEPSTRLTCVLIVFIVLLSALFPGDVLWFNDDPILIHNALLLNREGSLAQFGLTSWTQNIQYGPLPIWFYQIFLLFSHNMLILVVVHAVIFTALIGGGLVYLSLATSLTKWFIPIVLFSPVLLGFSRYIWDNTFCIPLSLLAVCSYVSFLRSNRWGVFFCILFCIMLILTHLMSLPIILAIICHAFLFRWKELRNVRTPLLLGIVLGVVIGLPYWPTLISGLRNVSDFTFQWWEAFCFTVAGGDWLCGRRIGELVGNDWLLNGPSLLRYSLLFSALVHIFVATGVVVAIRTIWRSFRSHTTLDLSTHLAIISLSTIFFQFIIMGCRGVIPYLHYYNASWLAYAVLAWIGLDFLRRWMAGNLLAIGVVILLLLSTVLLMVEIHKTHGTRTLGTYGPTLSDQLAVASIAASCSPDAQWTCSVPALIQTPHRILTLMDLLRPCPVDKSIREINIHYKSDDPRSGEIITDITRRKE